MNHTYRLVWNRALSMFVAVSETTRSMGKSGGVKALGGAVIAIIAMAAMPLAAHAQSTFLDFSSLDGWTTAGSVTATSGTASYNLGGQTYTLSPATSNSMVRITPTGSGIVGATAADTALGLSAGTIAGLLGANTTNFGLLSKSFTFDPGTYSFAWAYAASDYQPYNDGVLFSVVGQGTQNVLSLARNGSSATDKTGPQAGTLVLGSYGSTAWVTTTFDIATAGSYKVSYADYNWNDQGQDPVFYVSGLAGTFTGNAIGTPSAAPISAGTTQLASGVTAGTVAPTFTGGTLAMDAANAAYAQAFTLNASGGTIDQKGNASTFSGVFSNAGTGGPLHITNSSSGGRVTLTAANTYTGATDVATGATLALSGTGAIASSSGLALNGGALDISGTTNGAAVTTLTGDNGTVTLGSKTLTVSNASGTFGGTIVGTGGLTIAGGTQTITTGQAYTGTTTVNNGAGLTITGNGGGVYNSANVVNNGTIDVSGATFPTAFNNLSGTGTLALGATTTSLRGAGANFGGHISGTGGVIIDAANQTFSANNYYTGLTQIGATSTLTLTGNGSVGNSSGVVVGGVLDLSGAAPSNAVKALYGSGTVNLGSNFLALTGGNGSFGGNINGSGGIAVFGGTQVLSGVNTYTSGTQVFAGATLALTGNGSIAASSGATVDGVLDVGNANGLVSVGSLGGAGNVILGANSLTLNGAYDTFAGHISGSGGLTVAAGTETLSGVNTYTGATQVSGNLALAGDGSIAASSGVVLNGGTLNIAATTAGATVASLTGGNGFVTLGGKTLTVSNASGSFGGTVAGTGGLNIASGNQTITAGQAYTGATTVASGAGLTITGNGGGIYNSSNVVNDGAIDVSGATFPTAFNNLSGSGTLALGATTTSLRGAGADFAGHISGTGGVVIDATQQTFSANNYYTGLTQIGATSTLTLTGNGSVGNSSGVVVGGVLDLTGAAPPNAVKALYGSGTVNLGNNFLALTGGSGSFSGNINGSGGIAVFGGTQVLSGVNTYTSGTQVFAGATLALTGNGSIAASGGATVDGLLDVSNANGNVSVGSLGGAGNVVLGANRLTLNGAYDTFAGHIGGSGGLTIAAGTETLSGTQAYTGATQVSGNLVLAGEGSVASSSGVVLDGGTLNIAATTAGSTVKALTGNNGFVTLGSQTLTVSNASGIFGGTLFGTGGVNIAGGTQTITTGQAYTGTTTIGSGASLTIAGNGGGIYSSSNVVNNGNIDVSGATFPTAFNNLSGSGTLALGATTTSLRGAGANFSGHISGTGGVIVDATNQTFSANNYYTGLTQIGATSTLTLTGNGSVGNSSGVVVGGVLDLSGAAPSNAVKALFGSGTVNLGSNFLALTGGSGSFAGNINGSGGLAVFGGTQVLSGVNTYTSGTQVFAGATLALSGNGSIAASSGATVDGLLDVGTANGNVGIGSLGGAGNVALGANSLTLSSAYDTFAGHISGSGGLTIVAGNETLTGAQAYTGATQVSGNLVLAGDGSIAASSGVVLNGGTLNIAAKASGATVASMTGANGFVTLGEKTLTVSNASGTFGGTVAGSGGLNIAGGNQTITTGQAYTGTTTIGNGAGLSIIGNGGGIYNSAAVVNDGAIDVSGATFPTAFNNLSGSGTLALGAATTSLRGAGANFGGHIGGTGGVIVDAANQVFSNSNDYTGLTQIGANATLSLNGNGSIASSTSAIVDGVLNATGASANIRVGSLGGAGSVLLGANSLTLTGAYNVFGGDILGTGGLTVAGGIQTINAGLAYSGATQVDTGAKLIILGGGAAKSSNVLNNGTIDVSGATGPTSFNNLAGTGKLALGATTTTLQGAGADFAGSIDGSGGVIVAATKQTLSGVNSYTGLTQIGTGASLALAGSGSIAASSGVVANGALELGAATRLSALSGSGTVALGASQLTLTAASGNFAGVIAGSGGVAVTGGTQTLAGANTYTGATQVASGATLALTDYRAVAASSGVTMNGTLDISGANGGASIASLDGSGAVVLGTKQLVLSNAAGTFSGNISGTGGLFVNAGTQALTGVSTYTGNTQIDTGATLAIVGNGAITSSGGVLNNGTLTIASTLPSVMTSLAGSGLLNLVNQSVTFTQGADNFTGSITGTGTVSVTGGVQQLSGANTISGPVSATSGGTLRVASDVSLGAVDNGIVLNNGTLNTTDSLTMVRTVSITNTGTTLVNSGTTLTANGAIGGTGTLVKSGAGTLVLGADNSTLTGGAIVEGGTVKLAAAKAAGTGALTVKAGTLETAVNLTLAQNIALAGGTSILTDAATTTVLAGTVSTAAGGTGCFSKLGAGTLNVTGAASFGAGVCVQEGTLRINGLTGSNFVAVAQGATLRGAGTISGPVSISGTLAPGNSPGTLMSSATVTMLAGSNFQEDINGTGTASGPGNYSRLLISGAGQFVAGGATLTPNLVHITGADTYTPYVPKVGDNFRIVTASGGPVGRFGAIVQPEGLAANTRLAAFYNGDATHSIDLRVLPTSYAAYGLANGGNGNTQVAGVALDKIMTADQAGSATAQQAQLAYAVSNFAGSSVVNLAQNLAGEVHGAMAAAAPLAGQAVQGAVLRQMDGVNTATGALWADLAANRAEWRHDALASGFAANRGQLTVGVDAFRNDTGRIGVGYSHARANLVAQGGSGTLRENLAFVYGNYQGAGIGIDAMAGSSRTNWETDRANPLGAGALRTGLDGRNTLASIGVSAPWQVDGATFKPFVRVLWQRAGRDAGTEGAAMAALALGEFSASGTRTTAGLSGNVKGGSFGQTPYTMQYSVGAGRDNGTLSRAVVDSSMAGVGTTILAPHAGRSFLQAAVSGNVLHSANASSFYGVATEVHSGRTDVSLSGGLRYAF